MIGLVEMVYVSMFQTQHRKQRTALCQGVIVNVETEERDLIEPPTDAGQDMAFAATDLQYRMRFEMNNDVNQTTLKSPDEALAERVGAIVLLLIGCRHDAIGRGE